MNFQELEAIVQEKEEEAKRLMMPGIKKAASQIPLDIILDIVNHETIFSKHPRINEEQGKLRIAILHVPNLMGKFYVTMENDEMRLFRAGYNEPLTII